MTPEQAMLHAEQQQVRGHLAEAEQLYRRVINTSPDFHPAYHSLGLLAHKMDKPALAVDLITHAITLDNTIALYHCNLCEMLRKQGRLDEAINAGRQAIALAPDNTNAFYNLGLVQADCKDWSAAVESYQRVLELNPEHGLASNNMGAPLEAMGKMDEALEAYTRAVAINPQHAEAQNNMGAIYSERGMLDEARDCFSAAIKAQSNFIEPYYNLSSLKTFTVNDTHLIGLKKLQGQVEHLSPDAQIRYYFALGKAFEDIAEYDRAFSAYNRGNRLKFSSLTYNEARADTVLTRIKTLFDSTLFETCLGSGIEDATPIFIVGLPRSGTTLIEQILASHASVYGAGELKDLNEVILTAKSDMNENRLFNQMEPGLPGFGFGDMANNYLKRIRAMNQEAQYITDKMPANFFYIGFIHLMFPRAKIIHVMRDPMDSCFSCFSRLFNETMDFAYNLQTMGNYYVRYRQLMEHWQSVVPADNILEVHYEDIVADVESQTRRMLEYIDLPWDDACLEFYKNKRHVKTASVAQVRQPIYSTSVDRWQHFNKHLDPLMDIVKQYR